jgi:hypothetical protein
MAGGWPMITIVGVIVLLVALAIYIGTAAVFYTVLVKKAQQEPDSHARAEAEWSTMTQTDDEAVRKIA